MSMSPLARYAIVIALMITTTSIAHAQEAPHQAKGPHIEVELVASAEAVTPGAAFGLGVRFKMESDWHIYWREPGDSGLPPTFRWTLPKGFSASTPAWVPPTRHEVGDLVTMIYEGHILVPVTVQAPDEIKADTVTLTVAVDWLVCEDSEGCIPGQATLSLTLPVNRTPNPTKASAHVEAFTAVDNAAPLATPNAWKLDRDARTLTLHGDGPWTHEDASFRWFVQDWHLSDRSDRPDVQRQDGLATLRLPIDSTVDESPVRFRGVLTVTRDGKRHAYAFGWDDEPAANQTVTNQTTTSQTTPNQVGTPAVATAATTSSNEADEADEADLAWAHAYVEYDRMGDGDTPTETERSVWLVLALAFVGGLILNIMPCVLPVLTLKVLSFIDQAGEDPVRARRHGYAFAVGVVATFLIIAGLLLFFRGRGDQVGWGFQLQDPRVVVALAFLMFMLGLNLLGVFEVGTSIAGLAGRAQSSVQGKGYAGSVGTGVLATVIATPCTAPFMGPAIGYALTQPAVVALAVFGVIGLGMALPYVLLAVFPKLLKFVPRPGAWMETFKQAMAFPMFATVVWLGWVYSRQVGGDRFAWLTAGLLTAAAGAWAYGRFGAPHRKTRTRWIFGRVLGAAFVVAGVLMSFRGAPQAQVAKAPEGWVAYDGRAVREYQAAGQPVFLDFTADWCLTCKANEAAFLETDAVHAALKRHNVVAMQVDWTSNDPRITRALAKFKRSSVPLYVIAPPDPSKPVVVLRTAITTQYVVDALDKTLGTP